MKVTFTILGIFIWACTGLRAQNGLTVSDTMTDTELVELLVGSGVQVSNVSVNCPDTAYGSFRGNGTNFGIGEGVLLTTGYRTNAIGPNTQPDITGDNAAPGDSDLDSVLVNFTTNDACVMEFDIVPISDTLVFNYIFASDEYPEYISLPFNDAFAFFISGPGISGKQNIALIPGVNIPVSIDNVNDGASQNCVNPGPGCTNCQYYVNNCNGADLEYDGFTTVLQAKVVVQKCQTYHLKLAVADVGDWLVDSGVFIEAGSLSSGDITLEVSTAAGPGYPYAIEGCNPGIIKFTRSKVNSDSVVIHYLIGGTATNGVDYSMINDSIVIKANEASDSLNINVFLDGLPESQESLKLYLINPCTGLAYDSAVLYMQDKLIAVPGADKFLCEGDSVTISASGGYNYLWKPAATLADPTIQSPLAFPSITTQYSVTVSAAACIDSTVVNVTVNQPPTIDAGPDVSICSGDSVQLSASGVNSYFWTPATGLSQNTIPNPVANPGMTTTYVVSGTDGTGCVVSDTVMITVNPLPNVIAIKDTSVCPGETVSISATGAINYSWSPATTLSASTGDVVYATPLSSTTYTLSGADANGCINTDQVTIDILSTITVDAGTDQVLGTDLVAQLNGSTDGTSYFWSPSAGLSDPGSLSPEATLTESTTYTLCAYSVENCKICDTVRITVLQEGFIFMPNSFTPNGDGLNDFFNIITEGFVALETFKIYNRWGELVFESTDPEILTAGSAGWDGTINGQKAPIGVYAFIFVGADGSGKEIRQSGNITLIR